MKNNHLAFVQFSTRGKNNSLQTIQRFYSVLLSAIFLDSSAKKIAS